MNIIKSIEMSLDSINDAKFQDLINNLLYLEGYKFAGAPGSVVGKEKTSKGIPDSYFQIGDNYAFVECTTRNKLKKGYAFYKKLLDDIEHCFSSKTGIPPEKIVKIFLACTSKISPEELHGLKLKTDSYNNDCVLEVYNVQNLPYKLLEHPRLVDRFLEVRTVKGDIFTLQDFVLRTAKGIQPSLLNKFVGREELLQKGLDVLAKEKILLLSGPGGTGKSRLSVSIMEKLEETGNQPIVILGSVVPLWDDFIDFFQRDKHYIVLFDDANKSVKNLSYMLSFMQKPENGHIRLIITSRDYVKAEIVKELKEQEYVYEEILVGKLKDEDISAIITAAIPALSYHQDIKERIIALSKGNTRMAMMAAYSVTPESENNYLRSPVLLYEKYFEKLSLEIQAFKKPITLQALAIVAFFGQIGKNDIELEDILKANFKIDWEELWSTIKALHDQEVLDVYNDETVRVSDQVLATYAFYKCFIDPESARLDYGKWIEYFLPLFPYRVEVTLIDVNNTFTYEEIKKHVVPHLDYILDRIDASGLYSFYSIFWFYKSVEALLYIKGWVDGLSKDDAPETLEFSYPHNSYSKPEKYFELIVDFWHHGTEFLAPSLELAIDMVVAQPHRLGAFLKFMDDRFKYTFEDTGSAYSRQHILIDVLAREERSVLHREIATGSLIHITEHWLGWSFHQVANTRGTAIQIRNFDLVANEDLQQLRSKLLDNFFRFFEYSNEQSNKILRKIIYPGGNIDKKIYGYELDFYNTLISDKFSTESLAHCKFVKGMVWRLRQLGKNYPSGWDQFLNSETIIVYNFMNTDLEDRNGRGWQEIQEEKKIQIDYFVAGKEWPELEKFIYRVSALLEAGSSPSEWEMNWTINQLYFAIADKGKAEITNLIELTLAGKFNFDLHYYVLGYVMRNNILSGKELIVLIENSNSSNREYLITTVLEDMPAEQCTVEMVSYLIAFFNAAVSPIAIHHIGEWQKYQNAFATYLMKSSDKSLVGHNFISYLTTAILKSGKDGKASLGYSFCETSAVYFEDHLSLLKEAYYYNMKHNFEGDYDGKELESILKLDESFFMEYITKGADTMELELIRDNIPDLKYIWTIEDSYSIISDALNLLAKKFSYGSYFEHAASAIFTRKEPDEVVKEKMQSYIEAYIQENFTDVKKISMIMNIVIHKFPNKFTDYLKTLILLNKDPQMLKIIDFRTKGVMIGSTVPYIQTEIDKCK